MQGSKDGYSDQMYRDRNAGGFENKSVCCCFYLSKSIIVIFLAIVIICAGATSVLAVVFGYSQRWVYVVDRDVDPAYNLRTGWLYFNDNRGVNEVRLDQLSNSVNILGIVSLIMNALSVIFALMAALRSICGRLGRGFICFSVIFSILLFGAMLAFYIDTGINVYRYSQDKVGHAKYPWPDWGWCLGAGSALLWLIAAGLTSVMPKKSKYYADEMEFHRQRNDPNRPYQIPPPAPAPVAVQGTPVNGYEPSSQDPVPSTRNVPPMASQENTDYGEAPTKKSFMPNWAKRGSFNTEPSLPKAGGGSLKSRADEIRDRYRSQRSNADLEMGGMSERPKSAW